MPTITQLQAQKNNKSRVNVFVDGEFYCGLSLDDVVKNKLSVGTDLTEAELANLNKSNDFNKTLEYILKSPKTELQVKQYLYKKQYDQSILARLKDLGYINDTQYAENYIQAKSSKYGSRVIKQKLAQKGVKCEVKINDQSELALTIAQKYMRNKESTRENKAKLHRYLLAKGFDYDIVEQVCKSV